MRVYSISLSLKAKSVTCFTAEYTVLINGSRTITPSAVVRKIRPAPAAMNFPIKYKVKMKPTRKIGTEYLRCK